ncbi:conserved hypothetical protein [Treponema primitia ZAS-2]|uniref:Uncharacterized protein n=1 Tax=Treponema primitia (strain ATCC BAA-887 / DSM 12427 / ZAS-2) TaxID=545694 RepID=F5YLX1_TREPZ|nr:hypothetical protein [Treponema primitia]AEF84952.1 conserved hypothetical protein [Treponema primitia ZAS-2]
MKLEKERYFQLLEDDFIYEIHKDVIDKVVKEIENEDSLLRNASENFSSPKEIEISDTAYEELKKHSELLNKYEGNDFKSSCSFESYREKYEKEVQKNYKMRMIVEGLMDDYVDDMSDKIRVLLDILL